MLLSNILLCVTLQIYNNNIYAHPICGFSWLVMKRVNVNWWWGEVHPNFYPLSPRILTCEWPFPIHHWHFKLSVTQNRSGVIRAIPGGGRECCLFWGPLYSPLQFPMCRESAVLQYTSGTTACSAGEYRKINTSWQIWINAAIFWYFATKCVLMIWSHTN